MFTMASTTHSFYAIDGNADIESSTVQK